MQPKQVFSLILALLFLCSCASAPKADRVSEEEAIALREQYPYYDGIGIGDGVSRDKLFPTFEALFGANDWGVGRTLGTVVVLKVTEDWYQISDDPTYASVVWPVFDAEIEAVLWTSTDARYWRSADLKKGDTITVGFGVWIPDDLTQVYQKGDRYLCFLNDWRDEPNFHHNALFQGGKEWTYFLTRQDVLISVTSAPGQDSCTGMYLHTFEQLLHETMEKRNSPE